MNEPTELHPGHAMLLRKLRSISPLTEDEMHCILALPLTIKSVGPDQDIVREGDRPWECCLIVEGFACRYKLTAEGKRQIFSFHTPGDIPDLQSLHLRIMDHSLMTLTPCKLAFIPHQSLTDVMRSCPRVGCDVAGHPDRCGNLSRVDDRHRPPLSLHAHRPRHL